MTSKLALIAAAIVLSATAAQARDVTWSIGINAPLHSGVTIGTVFSNAPLYQDAPVFYRPAPVIYAEPAYYPQPVYVQPRVVYAPQPVYMPNRVVYAPEWKHKGDRHRHGKSKHRHRGEPVMVRYDR